MFEWSFQGFVHLLPDYCFLLLLIYLVSLRVNSLGYHSGFGLLFFIIWPLLLYLITDFCLFCLLWHYSSSTFWFSFLHLFCISSNELNLFHFKNTWPSSLLGRVEGTQNIYSVIRYKIGTVPRCSIKLQYLAQCSLSIWVTQSTKGIQIEIDIQVGMNFYLELLEVMSV